MSGICGRYVAIRDASTYYETAGTDGPGILLLHSAGRETRQWHGVMERLSGSYRLVAVDLPGHGKSMPMPGHRLLSDMDAIADWLGEFASAVFEHRFAVMGCSIGGNLSLLMAARFPDRVDAAVPLQGADYTPALSESGLAMLLHPQLNPLQGSVEFSRSLMGSQATAAGAELMMWSAKAGDPVTRFHDLGAYTRCDIRDEMAKVRCPVLLVHGTEDWIVPRDRVDATCDRLTNAAERSVVSIEGIGHGPHVEDPARLVEAVSPFLARHLGHTPRHT